MSDLISKDYRNKGLVYSSLCWNEWVITYKWWGCPTEGVDEMRPDELVSPA